MSNRVHRLSNDLEKERKWREQLFLTNRVDCGVGMANYEGSILSIRNNDFSAPVYGTENMEMDRVERTMKMAFEQFENKMKQVKTKFQQAV